MTLTVSQRPALPLTLAATLDAPNWLANPWWPVQHTELREVAGRSLSALHHALCTAPRHLAPILRQIAPSAANWAAALDEAALLASRSRGQHLTGEANLLQRSLFDGEARTSFLKQVQPKANPPMRRLEAELRHLARTLSWSRSGTWLRHLLRPKILAVAHNPLLVATARQSAYGVSFCHADFVVETARVTRPKVATERAREAAAHLSAVLGTRDLPDEIEVARQFLLHDLLQVLAELAETDLAVLAEEKLADEIWTGTFGKWSSRAIGLTVMGRGGKVVAFDHGGGVGNVCDPDYFQVSEVCGGAHFAASSPMAAEMIRATLLPSDIAPDRIISGRGDPSFNAVVTKRRPICLRPRVVYATTIFRGHRQYRPALLPDPLYLYWQKQVLQCLATSDFEAVFQPHPEGFLTDGKHPLSGMLRTSSDPFESNLGNADCFVFDYAHTTTFWKALCSDSAVILLDLGTNALGSAMRKMIEARGRIIRVDFDEDGIPKLDAEELQDAIAGAEPGDPTPFRALISAQPEDWAWPSL